MEEAGSGWIQLPSAIVEFVFAPEERDVYSYERTPKDLAPLGAKPPAAEPLPRQVKAIALLRSFGVKKNPLGYKHLAPLGRSAQPLHPVFRAGLFMPTTRAPAMH